MNAKSYINRADKMLLLIRSHLLGMDIPLYHYLPSDGAFMDTEEQLGWLTDRITFILISKDQSSPAQDIVRARKWLYAVLRYLYDFIAPGNFTLDSIRAFIALEFEAREMLFSSLGDCYRILLEPEPPSVLSILDQVAVELAGQPLLAKRSLNIENAIQPEE